MFKRIASLLLGMSVAASVLAVTPSAAAAGSLTVTGVLPTAGATNNALALCAIECINATGDSVTLGQNSAGESVAGKPGYHFGFVTNQATGAFTVFPDPNTYRVAVNYHSEGYSAVGYLKADATGGYTVTTTFADAASFPLTESKSLGELTINVPTPDGDELPDPQTDPIEVAGAVKWLNDDPSAPASPGFTVGLCEDNCISNGSVVADETGRNGYFATTFASAGDEKFVISRAPASHDYRVAVSFNHNFTTHNGYLASTGDGNYVLTDFATADVFSFTSDRDENFSVKIPYTAAPKPQPEPEYSNADIMPTMLLQSGRYTGFRFEVTKANPSTQVEVRFFGCLGNRAVAYRKDTQSGNRTFTMAPSPGKLGSNWRMQIAVTEAGKARRVEGWNSFGGRAGNFTCAKTTVPSHWIAKKSFRKGPAKAGKRAALAPTRLSYAGRSAHARVKYSWYVNGKRVKGNRTVYVKNSYRGKSLTAKVTVGKPGYNSRNSVIRYGRVR